jgi:dihydroorotate dehydrogenase
MNIYNFFKKFIFLFEPETAHNLAILFLKNFPDAYSQKHYLNLSQNIFGVDFKSPVGMSAGFDKNAEIFSNLYQFGFGFVEVGTVTKNPQKGNEKPRLFRLEEDLAIINRLGFNNVGSEKFLKNITRLSQNHRKSSVFGINIGKNIDSVDAVLDYILLLEKFYEFANYIVINVSSPNTKNLRDLQKKEHLEVLLKAILDKKNELKIKLKLDTPILLKVAPDLTLNEQEEIAKIAVENKINGLIISNTTTDRNTSLKNKNAREIGGISGKPLFEKSNLVLKNFYKLTKGALTLVGSGGIFSANDAYTKIKLGASLVQIYSCLAYQGFAVVSEINKNLSEMVKKDGFKNISEAIGVENI